MKSNGLFAPIRYSLCYLFGTYFLFSIGSLSEGVDNYWILTIFVILAYVSFYFGYLFGVKTACNRYSTIDDPSEKRIYYAKIIVIMGAVYLLVWGVNQMIDFGAQSVSQVIDRISNPGAAYAAKFDVYEARLAEQRVNSITQILIFLSLLFSLSVPLFAAYWEYISSRAKILFLLGLIVYLLSFMYIGTQKGLGDIAILSLAGWGVVRVRNAYRYNIKFSLRSVMFLSALVFAAILYMIINQGSRVIEFGLESTLMTDGIDIPNTIVAKIFGQEFANGFYIIIGYPTHGYIGLAKNLNLDFVFSYGAGLSQAFESYRLQYFGGEENIMLTYPYRTEALTGWPAGLYWSTAFPWLASDLTFVGVLPFMYLVGFLLARTWINCLRTMDFISICILGQLFIFIVFLPANNQVLMGRQGFLTVVGILLLISVIKIFKTSGRANP